MQNAHNNNEQIDRFRTQNPPLNDKPTEEYKDQNRNKMNRKPRRMCRNHTQEQPNKNVLVFFFFFLRKNKWKPCSWQWLCAALQPVVVRRRPCHRGQRQRSRQHLDLTISKRSNCCDWYAAVAWAAQVRCYCSHCRCRGHSYSYCCCPTDYRCRFQIHRYSSCAPAPLRRVSRAISFPRATFLLAPAPPVMATILWFYYRNSWWCQALTAVERRYCLWLAYESQSDRSKST